MSDELTDDQVIDDSSVSTDGGDAFESQSATSDLSGFDSQVDAGEQAQTSDAAPSEYEQPQAPSIDPQWVGAAYALGIQNPEQYAPEQLAYAIQARNAEVQQQIQFARQMQGDWSAYEAWKREQAAGAHGRAPAPAAPEPAPEPFDYRKAIAEALNPPTPPSYAAALLEAGHLVRTHSGKVAPAPGNPGNVTPEEVAEVNKWVDDVKSHDQRRTEVLEKAMDARIEQRLAEVQEKQQKEAHVRQFAANVERMARDPYGNPTPYGNAFMRRLVSLKDSNLPVQTKLELAHESAIGHLAPSLLSHAQQQWQAQYAPQNYGQPQSQSFSPPAQQPQQGQPAQPTAPPTSFLERAAQSPAGAGAGAGGRTRRAYRNEQDLLGVFDRAIDQLAGT